MGVIPCTSSLLLIGEAFRTDDVLAAKGGFKSNLTLVIMGACGSPKSYQAEKN